MPLFDRYVAVDWSANNSRKLDKDSIWSCVADRLTDDVQTRNHPTRRGAESWLLQELAAAAAAGERVLAGMDFPYGYPTGFAAALGLSGDPWRATRSYLTGNIVDDHDNRSNRFEVASDISLALGRRAPFWGRPQHLSLPGLSARKDVAYHDTEQPDRLPEWRGVERTLRDRGASPQPAWKLAYTGSVGSQTLLGVPVVQRLRNHESLRDVSHVWPFEVLVPDLPAGSRAVAHAEIWPSIVPFAHEAGSCADERQVRAVARAWRELDRRDHLATWVRPLSARQALAVHARPRPTDQPRYRPPFQRSLKGRSAGSSATARRRGRPLASVGTDDRFHPEACSSRRLHRRPSARARTCIWRISGADNCRSRRSALLSTRYFCNRWLEVPAATTCLLLLVVPRGHLVSGTAASARTGEAAPPRYAHTGHSGGGIRSKYPELPR